MYIFIHIFMYSCTHTHTQPQMHVCTHTNAHTHIHTHTYPFSHTQGVMATFSASWASLFFSSQPLTLAFHTREYKVVGSPYPSLCCSTFPAVFFILPFLLPDTQDRECSCILTTLHSLHLFLSLTHTYMATSSCYLYLVCTCSTLSA